MHADRIDFCSARGKLPFHWRILWLYFRFPCAIFTFNCVKHTRVRSCQTNYIHTHTHKQTRYAYGISINKYSSMTKDEECTRRSANIGTLTKYTFSGNDFNVRLFSLSLSRSHCDFSFLFVAHNFSYGGFGSFCVVQMKAEKKNSFLIFRLIRSRRKKKLFFCSFIYALISFGVWLSGWE